MSPCDPRLQGSFKDMWPLDLASESEGIQPCRVQGWGEAILRKGTEVGTQGLPLALQRLEHSWGNWKLGRWLQEMAGSGHLTQETGLVCHQEEDPDSLRKPQGWEMVVVVVVAVTVRDAQERESKAGIRQGWASCGDYTSNKKRFLL